MRGLSRAELIRVSKPGTAGARSVAEFVDSAGRMSWSGYQRRGAAETWFILFRFAIFAAFLASAALWSFLSQFASAALLLFIGSCIAVGASPAVAAIGTDCRVRLSLARIRAGRCSVCGYVLSPNGRSDPADLIAIKVRCPECGKTVVAATSAASSDAAVVEAATKKCPARGTVEG